VCPGRLHAFIEARLRHRDTRGVNLLNSSLSAWLRYYGFLEIIRSRYEQMSTPYVEAVKLQMERTKADVVIGQPSSRYLTQEELLEMQRLGQVAQRLHLDIESFYVFANILLDRIASTFRYYFWRKPQWNHRQLVQRIAKICEEKPLSAVPIDILTIPADLQRHVVNYRNTRIEHVEEPRFQFATMWNSDKKAKIYPTLLYPEQGEVESLQYSTGDINELLALIGRYIIAMLDFFDANAEKSILRLGRTNHQRSSE
jgi:hypothetical protein